MLEVKVGRVRKGMPPGMSAPKTKTLRRFGLLILMQRLLRPTIRMPTVTMWGSLRSNDPKYRRRHERTPTNSGHTDRTGHGRTMYCNIHRWLQCQYEHNSPGRGATDRFEHLSMGVQLPGTHGL